MNIQGITELTQDKFLAQTRGCAFVLLSSRFRNHNALLAWFLDSGAQTYFSTLAPDENTLETFLAKLVENLRDFDPKFGSATRQALQQSNVNPQDMADALATDLSKAKPKPHYLILDSFDYLVPSNQVAAFFYRLADVLPNGLQIIFNSRELSYDLWGGLVRAGKATVLGDDQTIDGGIFDPQKPAMPHLEVYGLAGGNVYVNGLPLTTWDGPLPRNLFYYFIDHQMVTRDDIFDTFWPDLPTKEATNVFHVTKRKISERLGFELTGYSGGFYRPSGQMAIHYDVERFETDVKVADEKHSAKTLPTEWYRAIRLYRAPFLHQLEIPWIQRRREQLRLTYANALVGVGRLHKSLNEPERAISYYLRALREVPEREDIHRDIMSLYASQGEIDKAVAQYHTLTDVLKRTLKITPSKPTRMLYDLITSKGNS